MAKNVVGLNDNNVLSALSVYDSNVSKTQEEINADNAANFKNISDHMNEHVNSGYWKNHQGTNIGIYYYENADTTTYSLPYRAVVVFVYRLSGDGARGVAWAIRWNDSCPQLWTCSMHDDTGSNNWCSWVEK